MLIKVLIFFTYVHVSTIDSSAECNFQCNDGQCIQDSWVCDDEDDCPSGEDEERGSCPDCNSQQFRCSTGRCIPLSYLCDNYYDCTTNEDESPQRCQDSGLTPTPTVVIHVTTEIPKVVTPNPATTEEIVDKVASTVEPTTSTIISAITSTSNGEGSFTTTSSVVTSGVQTTTTTPLVVAISTTTSSGVTSDVQSTDRRATATSSVVTSDIQSTTSIPLVDGKATTVSSGMTSEVQATTNMLLLNSQETSTQEGTTTVTELEYVSSNDTGVVTLPNESDKNEQEQAGSSIPSKLEGKEWIVGPIMGVIGPLIIVVSIIIGLLYRSNQRARRIGSVKRQAFEVNGP